MTEPILRPLFAVRCSLLAVLVACSPASESAVTITPAAIDSIAASLMAREHVEGLAIARIRDGAVVHVAAYGQRNVERALPLDTATVMYGASLTKTAVSYLVMQLVDEGRLDLDAPMPTLLHRPLPEYEEFTDLAGDDRWQQLTVRHLLTHTTGLPNFRRLEPDGVLRFHHAPGTRYGYSGEGFYILQLVLEEGLQLELGAAMQARVFDRFDMRNTSMEWRTDFAENLADGYGLDGSFEPHDERSRPSAAGSMDTSIGDQARMWAGIIRGDGLTPKSRTEMVRAQHPIMSQYQFPTLDSTPGPWNGSHALAAGLGVVTFTGLRGLAWFKGGHNDWTGNMVVCIEAQRECLVMLSNDVRAERIYPDLVKAVLGDTGMPWGWEYH